MGRMVATYVLIRHYHIVLPEKDCSDSYCQLKNENKVAMILLCLNVSVVFHNCFYYS